MISAVVVSWRSADLAERAIVSMREDAARDGFEFEAVAVENSGEPGERPRLEAIADRVIAPDRNLGFAGGLNAGLAAARGSLLLLSNADITLGRGALAALVAPLREGAPVASGPAFFWDPGETLLLPAAEEPNPFGLLRRRLGEERAAARPALFARAFREARRLREDVAALATRDVPALSGALVATTRRALAAAGPFDEGFALYYEENDWQRRLRATGGRLVRTAGARVVHAFNQSARRSPDAAAWFAASERRYLAKHFGDRGAAVAARAPRSAASAASVPRRDGLVFPAARDLGIAVSPLASFAVFALARAPEGTTSWHLPPDVRAGLAPGEWRLRAFRERDLSIVDEAVLVSDGAGPSTATTA